MEETGRRQILLIDGECDLLTRLKILLADEGLDVATAWGGREAWELLGSKRFDLILLSEHLPDTSGRALWQLLRRIPSQTELALLRGSDPMTADVRALLRPFAEHCVLPRSTPARIVGAVVHCLRCQATKFFASGTAAETRGGDS